MQYLSRQDVKYSVLRGSICVCLDKNTCKVTSDLEAIDLGVSE